MGHMKERLEADPLFIVWRRHLNRAVRSQRPQVDGGRVYIYR